jgi:hypothetical protein
MFFISRKSHQKIVDELFNVTSQLACELFDKYTRNDFERLGLRCMLEGARNSVCENHIEYHFAELYFVFLFSKKMNKKTHLKLLRIEKAI